LDIRIVVPSASDSEGGAIRLGRESEVVGGRRLLLSAESAKHRQQHQHQKECVSLVSAGYEVTLIVNDALPNEDKNGVKIKSLAIPVKNRRERIKKVSKAAYLKALEESADLYHIHDPELLPIAVELKKKQKKVVFDSHEFTA
jgi:hypothetical protein